MQMWFIQVITAMVYKVHIIACQVHVQGNIGMVGRVIVHQRDKKPDDVNNTQQCKKQKVNRPGQKGSVQGITFGKENTFSLQGIKQLLYFSFDIISYFIEFFRIHVLGIRYLPVNKFFGGHPGTGIATAHGYYCIERAILFYFFQ